MRSSPCGWLVLGVGALAAVPAPPVHAGGAPGSAVYTPVAPCRIADTRLASAGALAAGAVRTLHVVGSNADFPGQGGTAGGCGLPGFSPGAQVSAVVFNFVAVNPSGAGNLRAWASDATVPNASVLNYAQVTGLNIANGIVIPVRQDAAGDDLSVRADVSGAHLVVDVVGYFTPITQVDGAGSGLDADLLDGQDSAAFAAAGHNHDAAYVDVAGDTVTGNLVVNGDVQVGGTLQAPGGLERLRILRGTVNGNGTIAAGSGFTVFRVNTGNYLVSGFPGTTSAYSVVASIGDSTNATAVLLAEVGASAVQVFTFNGATPADHRFNFIAVGPR